MSKPHALFVDDEPRILDGLRRSLRGKRGDWDMDFVSEGAEALELLGQSRYDVIVSDMRMPGMDGAELLTNVSRRHPEVARVVLSGHIEPEATVQVAVAGHRFLTKPSDAETLTAVIEQLLVLTSRDHPHEARQIAGGVRAIPTLPEHTDRIVALLAPEANLADAVRTAMHDVGLTAKLLQLSNSRFFGAQPRNASVESIVNAMGVPMVQAVAGAGHALRPESTWSPTIEEHLRAAWRHAVATACLMDLVASPANRPQAQAAALLQDVGRLVCLAGVADEAGSHVDLHAQTRDGVPFRDVGVELLHLWGLPTPIITAVARRDTPQTPEPSGLGVAAAVRAAHLLIQGTRAAGPDDGTHEQELKQLLAHPQLQVQAVDWFEAADEASRRADSWNSRVQP
ncbi:response regulator [Actinoplanes sp. NPDC051346]|uniref:response regulator n=1 Tax=Actinoplanes sp. NPDC051346 TaxID=3155048 RepID=UPI0034168389